MHRLCSGYHSSKPQAEGEKKAIRRHRRAQPSASYIITSNSARGLVIVKEGLDEVRSWYLRVPWVVREGCQDQNALWSSLCPLLVTQLELDHFQRFSGFVVSWLAERLQLIVIQPRKPHEDTTLAVRCLIRSYTRDLIVSDLERHSLQSGESRPR